MKITVIIALKGVSFNHHTLQLFTKKETPRRMSPFLSRYAPSTSSIESFMRSMAISRSFLPMFSGGLK